MTLMLQSSGVSIPSVQSAPPPPLQAPVVPAIQSGPPLPSVGPSSSPLRPVTLAFTSPVLSSSALSRQCHQLLLFPLLLWRCL
jgi:hypothetical protein